MNINKRVKRIHSVTILAFCAAMSGCKTGQYTQSAAPDSKAGAEQLFFSESFDYPKGRQLSGMSGGAGFANAWGSGGFNADPNAPFVIGDESLAFENLSTTGRSCNVTAQERIVGIERALANPSGFAKIRSTRYVSVVIRPGEPHGNGPIDDFFGLCLRSKESELFVGKPGHGATDKWVMEERGGTAQVATTSPVAANQATLLVLKIEYAEGNDRLTLYVNPRVQEAEPTNGTVKADADLGVTDTVLMYSTGAFTLDELRAGETFRSVLPIKK